MTNIFLGRGLWRGCASDSTCSLITEPSISGLRKHAQCDRSHNPWCLHQESVVREIHILSGMLEESEADRAARMDQINILSEQIRNIYSSTSWRVTRPMRFVEKKIKWRG